MDPRYLSTRCCSSSTCMSPARLTSTLSVVSWLITAPFTCSRVSTSILSAGTDMNRSLMPEIWPMSSSVVLPSRLLVRVSCDCLNPCFALASASSSHTKPVKIWCTTCRDASSPLMPPFFSPAFLPSTFSWWRLVVGKRKSSTRNSSLQSMCTSSKWSMQNSSTCSLVKVPNAPPSCMVLAPTATAPVPNSVSTDLPPGTMMRMCPRWLSLPE
mmetsp:Transcript_1866/g.2615  ORF Transcript_1866/g.2615 Transcript_1866/m.2615 type:complete len:213 (+) Transcript_1866:1038-1676(+)